MDINVIPETDNPTDNRYARRSDVWEFMNHVPNSPHVVCILCGLHLTASSRSGTSNLRNHLINRHSDKYKPKKLPRRNIDKVKYDFVRDPYAPNDDAGRAKDGEISSASTEIQEGMEGQGHGVGGASSSSSASGIPGANSSDVADADVIASASKTHHTRPKSKRASSMSTLAVMTRKRASVKSFQHSQPANSKRKPKPTAVPTATLTASRTQSITNMIFRMVVEDLLPLSVVEGTGFRKLVDGLQKGYTFPTKVSLEDRLNVRLEQGRENLGTRLAVDGQKIGLTCDLWTDYSNRNYITLTAHRISQDWGNESWILGTIEVNANTTDEEVSSRISALCLECGISIAAVVGVVYGTECTHPVADIDERLRVLKTICAYLSWECRPCAGELLGISVQNVLSIPPVSDLILAAEQLITHLTVHRGMHEKLCALLQERKQATTFTLCDVSSRWETICSMFCQLAEWQEPIDNVLEDKEMNLTEAQWKLLHELIRALQSIKAAIAVMGDAMNKSVSCWLPVIQGVLQNLEAASAGEQVSEAGKMLLTTLKSELQTRCELNEILPSSLMMLASAVDPRFHHLRFLSEEDRVPVIAEVKRQLAEQSKESQNTSADAQEGSAFFALLGEDEFNQKGTKAEDEIDLFRLERPVSRETDPLTWWHLNENRFPRLAKLAKAILCVPAAASPLSVTNDVKATMENRKRLESAKNVDAQLFLHKNIGLFV